MSELAAFYVGGAFAYLLQGACHTIRLSGTRDLSGGPMLTQMDLGFSFGYVILSAVCWPLTALVGLFWALRGQPKTERVFKYARLWFYANRLAHDCLDRDPLLDEVERRLYNELADEEQKPKLQRHQNVNDDAPIDGEKTLQEVALALGGSIAYPDGDLAELKCEQCDARFRAIHRKGKLMHGSDLVTAARKAEWFVIVEFDGVQALCAKCEKEAKEAFHGDDSEGNQRHH